MISDLVGQVFGRLTVMYLHATRTKARGTQWVCQCSCGNVVVKPSVYLVEGTTKSCGCLRDEVRVTASRKLPFESAYNYLLCHAKLRGISLTLTFKDFVSFTSIQTCHYCGKQIIWRPYRERCCGSKSPSNLDRKNSGLGYDKANLVVCCWDCNRGKGNQFSYERWYFMTTPVRELRKELERYEMKIKKTSVFRLELEKDNCSCRISREFADGRYVKPLADPVFTACEKHAANEEILEFAKEIMTETLADETLNASRQYAPLRREVEEGDSAGVVATGESVQAVGATGLPKRQGGVRTRQKTDPLQITKVSVDRSDQRLPKAAAVPSTDNLVIAAADEDGISITGDIETVPEDPRLSGLVADGLDELDDVLDEADMKDAGVPRNVLNQARD